LFLFVWLNKFEIKLNIQEILEYKSTTIGELLNYILGFLLIGFLDKEAIGTISKILEIFLVIYFYSVLFDLKNICKFKKIGTSTSLFIILNAISTNAIIDTFLSVIDSKFIKLTPVISINTTNNANIILALVLAIFITPVFEEILFRGLILNELRNHFNLSISILTQAVIFGLFHLNRVQAIYTFIAGIVLALIYIWTDSIYSTIICHFIYNLTGILIFPAIRIYFNPNPILWVSLWCAIFIGSLVTLYMLYKKNITDIQL
ncbi:CPBP family intramembrane glutamic endopeptidase, partial [Clostridium sp. DJ247]|uniref:CPBP family intramembrane glutamic endopeptidase n=1 Tax=Clostridium sp. DJ247 TaxID=2726188 RepID=UPI001627123B